MAPTAAILGLRATKSDITRSAPILHVGNFKRYHPKLQKFELNSHQAKVEMIYTRSWYPFDAQTIHDHVPPTSGVYSLFSHQECVYVGASQQLQEELARSLKSAHPCISQYPPDEFQFEVVLGNERLTRRDELISELNPTCRD